MAISHGTIVWNELNTHDVEGAKRFYGELFGWQFSADNPQKYLVALQDGEMAAGIFDLTTLENSESIPASWLTYFETEDIDKAIATVEASGGTCLRPVFHVPGVGRIGIILDNTGASLGLMQSDKPA